jgi:hypothetical protein
MLLMRENATVTLWSQPDEDLPSTAGRDIIVAAAGQAGLWGSLFRARSDRCDVGAHWTGRGQFTGDADLARTRNGVAITRTRQWAPDNGGAGAEVAEAAERQEEARGINCRLKIGFLSTPISHDNACHGGDNYAKYLTQYADVTVFTTVVNRIRTTVLTTSCAAFLCRFGARLFRSGP